jgi:2-amino-4-hydroxy-6-hydroxymethyldihydropteridine diphosphokinase
MTLPINPSDWREPNIFLALGSNLGHKAANLKLALLLLQNAGMQLERVSRMYESPPWGVEEQPSFINLVCRVSSPLLPMAIVERTMDIERKMGRVRRHKWGPREIDIDLLAYGDTQMASEMLTLPHPHLHERAFVLVPWAEIAPSFPVVGLNQTVNQLLEGLRKKHPLAVEITRAV